MRNINVVKYRKLLYNLQYFCRSAKGNAYTEMIFPKKILTDYERGYIDGRHAAYNDVLREVHEMQKFAEYDWESVHCREEIANEDC